MTDITIDRIYGKNGVFLNFDGYLEEVVNFDIKIENVAISNSFSQEDATLIKMYDLDQSTITVSNLVVKVNSSFSLLV